MSRSKARQYVISEVIPSVVAGYRIIRTLRRSPVTTVMETAPSVLVAVGDKPDENCQREVGRRAVPAPCSPVKKQTGLRHVRNPVS